jgi:hypothetical protein
LEEKAPHFFWRGVRDLAQHHVMPTAPAPERPVQPATHDREGPLRAACAVRTPRLRRSQQPRPGGVIVSTVPHIHGEICAVVAVLHIWRRQPVAAQAIRPVTVAQLATHFDVFDESNLDPPAWTGAVSARCPTAGPTKSVQNCTDAGRKRAQTCCGWCDKQSHDDPRRPESAMAGRPQRDAVGGDAGRIMDPHGRRRRQPGQVAAHQPSAQTRAPKRAGGSN